MKWLLCLFMEHELSLLAGAIKIQMWKKNSQRKEFAHIESSHNSVRVKASKSELRWLKSDIFSNSVWSRRNPQRVTRHPESEKGDKSLLWDADDFQRATFLIGVTAVFGTAWRRRRSGFQGASKVIVIQLLMLRACVSSLRWTPPLPLTGSVPVTVVGEFVVAGKGN